MDRVHEQVLKAACALASQRPDWTFEPIEIVQALRHLNESSVRTHVVSRCCVEAPKNHAHKWDYFSRVGRGRYQVRKPYRRAPPAALIAADSARPEKRPRNTIHGIVQKDGDMFVVECLEVAVVSQGATLDQAIENVQQAVGLHLDGEDLHALGLAAHPRLEIIYDLPLSC
jgi:predicted RNase H-like HicB family nuclease